MRKNPWLLAGLVLLGACAIWAGLGLLSDRMFGPEYSMLAHTARAPLTFLFVVVLLAGVLRVQRVPASRYGLIPDRSTPLNLGLGALGYLVPFAVGAVVVLALGLATLSVTGTAVQLVVEVLAVIALVLLYEAIPEELIFRGYLFSLLRERLPLWATVLGQAALFCAFGFVIGAARTPDRLFLFLLFSLALGVVRAATGSVFASIGFHAAFQLATQPILGSQWTALTLDDPERWFADIAFGLAPLVLGPLLVVLVVRARRSTPGEPD